jgi:RimJ/RimL family protein N-acetyltransferase
VAFSCFQVAGILAADFCLCLEDRKMSIDTSLYEGKLIRFASIDMEKDPAVMARWMQSAEYLRMNSLRLSLPASAARIKKQLEKIEKEQDEAQNGFYFTLRSLADDRLVGYTRLYDIEWANGCGKIQLSVGEAEDRRAGYGTEALAKLLHYAFAELNLYRVAVRLAEYNQPALGLFEKAGFTREVCRKQAVWRDGRAWDVYILGLLHSEWQARQE